MKVKTLRSHTNIYGPHKVGDVYEHRSPASDIKFGYVEEVLAGDGKGPTIDDLKKQAAERGIELPTTGSGKDGRVVKADIEQALKDA